MYMGWSAGEVLESAIFLSVKLEDEVMFERNYMQLKTFYADARQVISIIVFSSRRCF